MKAVFKGYKANGSYEFTVGKVYDLTALTRNGYYEVCDDDLSPCVFKNGFTYDFEALPEDKPLSSSELLDYDYDRGFITDCTVKNPQIEEKRFTYYINEMSVTKERFDSAFSFVKDFEAEGVDTSSIKFELKFE